MKNDEFAFFNQQLAAMLRDGIPLEGALRRLCADMRRGRLRAELEKLGADLASGTSLSQPVQARAIYQSDLLLASALPAAILGLGLIIVLQMQPMIAVFWAMMNDSSIN